MIYNRYFEKPEEADKYMDEVKKFVSDVYEDKYEKDDIKEKIESYYMRVTRIASGFRSEVFRLNKAIDNWENMNSKETMLEIVSSKFNTKAEVIIAKNRGGSTGTVELGWLGSYTKFVNLERRFDD